MNSILKIVLSGLFAASLSACYTKHVEKKEVVTEPAHDHVVIERRTDVIHDD